MDKIRLGNDIEMRWSIFTRDGDNRVPYDLEGRALTLSVVNRKGESEIEFFAEGNIVTGVFRGRDQKILGKHGVILRENNGKDGMRTVDACDAFELVACSCEEALGSPGTIQLFHLTFDTTVGAITGTIDPILNYEAEQAEAERKANEIVRKADEEQRIENENQRKADETLRKVAEEARAVDEQERKVGEDLREANEAARIASEEARSSAEAIRAADEAARAEAETARREAEKARADAEEAREEAEAARVKAEKARVEAESERQAKFAAALVQETGQDTGKVMSQKAVTDALEGKQEKLVPGDNITIVGNVISSTGGGPGGSIDLSSYAKKEDVDAALEGKQDTIPDLDAIRQGAAKGSTALQSESDPVYLADKPKLALKVEIPDVSGKVDKVTGKGLSSNDYTDADKLKLTALENYDDTQVRALIAGKQDTIADLDAIREGAALGKTALQEHQDISKLATKEEVATKQDTISDLATIRSGAAKGATALQSYTETDPVYMADKPSLALKSEIPDISGKADKTFIVTETVGKSSYSIVPNRLTRLGTLASNVTLSLNTSSEEAGVVNVYDIIFATPTTAPSITWPEGVSWVGGSAPSIAGGKTYEVSIMDNLATYGEF